MDPKQLVAQMTLEEKASLTSGADFWHTKAIERLNIPSIMVTDGPHGLRKQGTQADHLGLNEAVPATCFPAACNSAASWNRELLQKEGKAMGEECQAENVALILGPGATMKRSPLCGRNFEYFSEDPYLSSQMASNIIQGIQSKGVGTSLKHYLCNNQETHRMTNTSVVDERTLHEIYLRSFEDAVKEAKPTSVMCSYNRLNDYYVPQNKWALTDVLRGLWGYEGFVVSDWGAVDDRVPDLKAGLDLQMPGDKGANDKLIVEAVKNGTLDEKVLDQAVERILRIVLWATKNADPKPYDKEEHHRIAKEIAQEGCVLLKNEDNILPLPKEAKVAYIGEFAEHPHYQGGGSSHINSTKVSTALESSKGLKVEYAQGYQADKPINQKLVDEAIEVAKRNDYVVVFAGLPDSIESEGFDRKNLDMPENQNTLISALAKVNKNIIVVLQQGSPIVMPWLNEVKAVLEAYIGGQAINEAIVSIIFGDVNPSGKLPETFPRSIKHTPCYDTFGEDNETDATVYSEGVFVGYRWYDRRDIDVLFPFGYGLSYTTFEYSNLRLSSDKFKEGDELTVTVNVKNTGKVAGKEIVQLYVGSNSRYVKRPVRELREYTKILLQPGEAKDVTFKLNSRAFAWWSVVLHNWYLEPGKYTIEVGKSSRDIVLTKEITVEGKPLPIPITRYSMVGQAKENPIIGPKFQEWGKILAAKMNISDGSEDGGLMKYFLYESPIRTLNMFTQGEVTDEMIEEELAKLKQ